MIRFERIPIHEATTDKARFVPYLDVSGEDEPIEFLFTLGEEHGFIARANLHTLRGAPKTGKSALGLALITAALKGECIGIKARQDNLSVLWIDTEQDKNTLRQKARAVLDMAGLEAQPEALKIVTLRGYGGPVEALDITLKAIEENTADFVFLDGVVDLCQAFNDEERSKEVVMKLEAYSELYGVAILGLIHTNKKDDEARGHLGAIMQQKSAEIYQVNKRAGENLANVTQPFSRYVPVPSFAFAFADNFKITTTAGILEQKKEEELEQMRSKFAVLYNGSNTFTQGKLVEAYTNVYDCCKRTAENAIKAALEARILLRDKRGSNVYYSYLFPDILDTPSGAKKEDEDNI